MWLMNSAWQDFLSVDCVGHAIVVTRRQSLQQSRLTGSRGRSSLLVQSVGTKSAVIFGQMHRSPTPPDEPCQHPSAFRQQLTVT